MGNVRMRAEQIKYGASNVKDALDDLDPKDLIALSARMDTIEAWKATVKAEEKTGASVEFTNALALAAVSLSAEIEASQDLHGLPFPYVGGAYKNKFALDIATLKSINTGGTWTGNSYAYKGVTIDIITDDASNITALKMNGTASERVVFSLATSRASLGLASGNYVLSKGTSGKVGLIVEGYNGDAWYTSLANSSPSVDEVSFTVDYSGYDKIASYINISQGVALNNDMYYPMIRLSGTSADFAPYSNVCPISGRTEVTITDYDSESNTATVTIQLGTTVYGARINWDTGEVEVISAKKVLTSSDVTGVSGNQKRMTITISGVRNAASDSVADDIIQSDKFKALASQDTYSGNIGISVNTVGAIGISIGEDLTLESAQQYVTDNAIEVVYPLATPTTLQLTPTQLTMLKGYNRLSSDGGGEITVEAYTGAPWGGDE